MIQKIGIHCYHHYHHYHFHNYYLRNFYHNYREATDICTVNSNSPVIAVSYSNGDIDFLIFSLDPATALVILNPCWSDIDKEYQEVQTSMTIVETISIEKSNDNIKKSIKLRTDPLNSHCIYAIVSTPSSSSSPSSSIHLILSKWMFNAMNGNNIDKKLESSIHLPIYNDDNNNSACCGIIITFDSILGHCAILRFTSGDVVFINLSAHMRICEFQNTVNTIEMKTIDDLPV